MSNSQSPIPGSQAFEERKRYVKAFNSTMIKIWQEQISLLGVIDTGALYRSVVALGMNADGKYTSVTLSQSFNTYGLFVDYGTGSNTPRGNSGDLGDGYTNRRAQARHRNLQEGAGWRVAPSPGSCLRPPPRFRAWRG